MSRKIQFKKRKKIFVDGECDKVCKDHPNSGSIIELTPHGKHYGKFICKECKKYIIWAKNPKTTRDIEYRRNLIVDTISNTSLLDRDKIVDLCDLYSKAHLNLIEQSKWKRLFPNNHYLEDDSLEKLLL